MKNDIEKKLKLRRHKIWLNHIAYTKQECDPKIDFAHKNIFIEDRIEFTQKYFGMANDLHMLNNEEQKDINKIKRELFKFQRNLKNKKKTYK